MSGSEKRIYIGNLPPDIRNKDIEDLFYKYGKIKFIDLKNRRGPPFAFVEFDDPRDADDAVYARYSKLILFLEHLSSYFLIK